MSNSSDHKGTTHGEFSVAIINRSGTWWYTRRWVGDRESAQAFFYYCTSVAARLGLIKEVRLIDGGDCTNLEWEFESGIRFPPEYIGVLKRGIDDDEGGHRVRELGFVPDSTDGGGSADQILRGNTSDSMVTDEAAEAAEGSGRDDSTDKG